MARDKHSDSDIARYTENILTPFRDSAVSAELEPEVLRIIQSVRAGEETWHARYGTSADRRTFLHGVGVELDMVGSASACEGNKPRATAAFKAAFEAAHLAFRQSEARDPMRGFHGASMIEYAARVASLVDDTLLLQGNWWQEKKSGLIQASRTLNRHQLSRDLTGWGFARGYEDKFGRKIGNAMEIRDRLLPRVA